MSMSDENHAGLPELQEKGAEKETEGAIEGVEKKLTPDSSKVKGALQGVAAGAVAAGAAAAAKALADHARQSGNGHSRKR